METAFLLKPVNQEQLDTYFFLDPSFCAISGTLYFEYAEDFQLPMDILIVYGEKDRSGKVISYSKRWAKEENRKIVVIPDAAHNANMDNPRAFNEALSDFLLQHG